MSPVARVLALSGLLILTVSTTADGVGAQVSARLDRASLLLPVTLTIGPRLMLASAGPAAVTGRTPAGLEMELPFTVAANVSWSITMGLAHTADPREPVQVLTDSGRWLTVNPGATVRVIGRRDPSEPTVIRIRVRLPSNARPGLTDVLRFSIGAAEGSRLD